MVHILMLLWQHARFQSPASSKLNISICDSTRQNTWSHLSVLCIPVPPSLGRLFNIFNCILCSLQLQMVIFDFEEEGTGTEHVAIATSKCESFGIFCRVQHPCQGSIALLHYWRSHHSTCTTDDIIREQICIIGKLEYLWNKKDITKRKTPFYSTLKSCLNECIF